MLSTHVVPALEKHSATLFFLHGDSGLGWKDAGEYMSKYLKHFKFVFPNAPSMPVTINGGMRMPAWYDILQMDIGHETREDLNGMEQSRKQIMELIDHEMKTANLSSDRIALGGFSQGGAITLYTLSNGHYFGAAIGLSTYLPNHKKFSTDKVVNTPLFMGHGTSDNVVRFEYGKGSAEIMEKINTKPVAFKQYVGMAHSGCNEEIHDVIEFLKTHIPPQ